MGVKQDITEQKVWSEKSRKSFFGCSNFSIQWWVNVILYKKLFVNASWAWV